MDDNWVKVYSDPEFLKVELAQNFLEENKIETYLMDHSDSAYVMLGEVQLFTPEDQAAKATELLEGKEF